MILRKVTRTAPSITLGQHHIRGHLTLTEDHFDSTKESGNFDSIVGSNPCDDAINQQVILAFKHHYDSIILVILWGIIMILIWTEIFLCVGSKINTDMLSLGKHIKHFRLPETSATFKNNRKRCTWFISLRKLPILDTTKWTNGSWCRPLTNSAVRCFVV